MSSFNPVNKLEVTRTLSTGERALVGVLAQNKQGAFFQYDADYLNQNTNLSPFQLEAKTTLQKAPEQPHYGLHGVFADSLPDGWGLLLQDRVFRQNDILPAQVTALDRLAFVGQSAMGALSFSPVSQFSEQHAQQLELAELGLQAQAIFDGQTEEIFSALVAAGSSGGARPKAQLFFENDNFSHCTTSANENSDAWLVKFTSKNLPLGHEEGLCEAVYLTLAENAGLSAPEWKLLEAPSSSSGSFWLAVKRFDYVKSDEGNSGRLHMHSACGLLNADFRMPSLDYQDLIKASSILCKSPAVGQMQFKRSMFNLFGCNQDDHSKNWAFLQADDGQWQLAPFYDVTFSPTPYGEHSTSYYGFGKAPSKASIQKLASIANYSNWANAKLAIEEVVNAIQDFSSTAKPFGVHANTIRLIQKQLDNTWQANKSLLT